MSARLSQSSYFKPLLNQLFYLSHFVKHLAHSLLSAKVEQNKMVKEITVRITEACQ